MRTLEAVLPITCFALANCALHKPVERMEDVAGCYVNWANGQRLFMIGIDGSVTGRDGRQLARAVLQLTGDPSGTRVSILEFSPPLALQPDQTTLVVASNASRYQPIIEARGEITMSIPVNAQRQRPSDYVELQEAARPRLGPYP